MSIFFKVFDQAGKANKQGVSTTPPVCPDGQFPLSTYDYTLSQIQVALDRQGKTHDARTYLQHLHQVEADVVQGFIRACAMGILTICGIQVAAVLDPCSDDSRVKGWLRYWSDGRHKAQSREGKNQHGVLNAYGDVTLTGSGSTFFDFLLVLADGRIIPVSVKAQWLAQGRALKPKVTYSSDGRTAVARCLAGMPYATVQVGVYPDGSAVMEWIDTARAIRVGGEPARKTVAYTRGKAPAFYYVVKSIKRTFSEPREDWYLVASHASVKRLAMDDESITYGRTVRVAPKGKSLTVATDWNPADLPDGLLASAFRLP